MLIRIFLLLAIIEVAPLIKAHEKRSASSVLFGNNCKIQSIGVPTETLNLLSKEKEGLASTSVELGSPLNSKWNINKLTLEGYTFYEIFNRQYETYLINYYYTEQWMVTGTQKNHAASGKRDTLWQIEPAQLNVPVTIKHAVTGSYLTVPRGSFAVRKAYLASTPVGEDSKWKIIC
jgi:hypothetical protein